MTQCFANGLPFLGRALLEGIATRAIGKAFDEFGFGQVLEFHLGPHLNHVLLGHGSPLALALLGIEDAMSGEAIDATDNCVWLRSIEGLGTRLGVALRDDESRFTLLEVKHIVLIAKASFRLNGARNGVGHVGCKGSSDLVFDDPSRVVDRAYRG